MLYNSRAHGPWWFYKAVVLSSCASIMKNLSHTVTFIAWIFSTLIRVSFGCGFCGVGNSASCMAKSVDGIFWHHDGDDFGLCEADTRDETYRGSLCFKRSDASQSNNFCMLDNSQVYYSVSRRDYPSVFAEHRHQERQVDF